MALYRNMITTERREFAVNPGVPWKLIGQPATITYTEDNDDDGSIDFAATEVVLAVADIANPATTPDYSTPDFGGSGGDFGGGGSDTSW